jgi:hypothetical protein
VIGALARALRGTGRFLWSFFVDDTPEVLVIVAVIVGAAYALRHHNALAVAVLPLVTVVGLGLCVWRACRARPAVRDPAVRDPAVRDAAVRDPATPNPTPPLHG